ncbi:hypothetical protein ACIBEJ_34545 [Nonomuraea sp. NPDC050790]|uniref:hypothetical protein n=1 Tax=Nonomuraea sp. NPDC050790 TaxID=3364371 RepID=UPI0037A23019
MKAQLPTIPVDAAAIRDRHLIQTDEQLVRVRHTYRSAPGQFVFVWVSAEPITNGTPRIGSIEVAGGDTVQCVRVADWLASVRREAATA